MRKPDGDALVERRDKGQDFAFHFGIDVEGVFEEKGDSFFDCGHVKVQNLLSFLKLRNFF